MFEILTVKAWALETRFFNRMAPIVLRGLGQGKDLSYLITESPMKPKAYWDDYDPNKVRQIDKNLMHSGTNGYFFEGADPDTIIPYNILSGVVSKNGQMCGPSGTYELGAKMQMDDVKPIVSAHFLYVDSPGGDVDGTKEIATIIAKLTKPVIVFVDGMAASAAYWISSQATHIVTNSLNYSEVGSIGTLCMLTNQAEYLKKEGLKVEIMRASKSTDKARLNSIEEWPEESLAELQTELNTINSDFIKSVNTGRNGKLFTMGEDIFTGKMYDQKRALAIGMIDQIGSIDDAIKSARTLAKKSKLQTTI